MKKIDLNADIRNSSGKGESRRLRKNNYVPAILYDNTKGGTLLKVDASELNSIISKSGEHVIVKLNIQGKEMPTVIREVQRDPVFNSLIHIDFMPVLLHEIIHAEIPIMVLNGEAIEKNGWVINRQIATIEVEGEVEKIPSSVTLDVSKYKSGDVLKVADLEVSKEISIVSDYNDVILSIIQSKQALESVQAEEKQLDTAQI